MLNNRRDLIKREKLADILPLKTPFTIYVDPSSVCNFKCSFCCHSLKEELKEMGFEPRIMSFEFYKKIIDQAKEFPDKVKMLCLFLNGESLINKKLTDMIEYARASNIAERIFLTTNGSLLTKELNRNLIDAGLNEILISIEALNAKLYRKIAGVDVDFNKLIDNISDLYHNKKDCKVFIKIVDMAINTDEEVKQFHYMFDNICDLAYIEPVVPVFEGVDYSNIKLPKENRMNKHVDVCTRPFFTMTVHPNGNVGCCIVDYNEQIVLGNIEEQSLLTIWNGEKLNDFRITHLKKQRTSINICRQCTSPYYDTQLSDFLDDKANELINTFSSNKEGKI